jgi:type IV fimbrial biogenesis protein FimT
MAPCGFTLLELVTAVAIVAVLVGIAIPTFLTLIQKQRVAIAANDLFSAITLTRSEAIRRGERVDLVPRDGASWASGWVVFMDANHNHLLDQGEIIIRQHAAVGGGMAIKSAMTDSSMPYIAFTENGRTRTNANTRTPQAGHIALALGAQQRRIVLNFLGRPRLCDPVSDKACG